MRALILVAAALLSAGACRAQERPELVLRNSHYFVVVGDGQAPPTIDLQARQYYANAGALSALVTDPAGETRLQVLVPMGERAARAIAGPPAELYLVTTEMAINGVVFGADRPWAVYAGGTVGFGSNGPVPEMYLWVPPDTDSFALRVRANSPNEGGRVVLHRPDGTEALVFDGELDAEQRQEVEVPPDGRGAVWSLTWARPETVQANLDDINVFVEGALTPLLWPERDWAAAHGQDLWELHRAALAEEAAQ